MCHLLASCVLRGAQEAPSGNCWHAVDPLLLKDPHQPTRTHTGQLTSLVPQQSRSLPDGLLRGEGGTNLQGEVVSNHDELMCNFFAQADALATGKTAVELRAENVPDHLIPHKTFTGNRPSLSIMLPDLKAYTIGQILSLYENRIAVQVRTCGKHPVND